MSIIQNFHSSFLYRWVSSRFWHFSINASKIANSRPSVADCLQTVALCCLVLHTVAGCFQSYTGQVWWRLWSLLASLLIFKLIFLIFFIKNGISHLNFEFVCSKVRPLLVQSDWTNISVLLWALTYGALFELIILDQKRPCFLAGEFLW